jgi:hypothetical protein
MTIFTFFDKLKETLKFWASGCHFKGHLPPHSTLKMLLQTAECARSKLEGGRGTAGPIFPP